MSHFLSRLVFICGFIAVSLLPLGAAAQTAPRIDALFPAGGQRGTRVDVELQAEFLPAPCGLSIAGGGIQTAADTVSDRFTVSLDAEAAAGRREVRIFAPQGGSAPYPFLIGELPEIIHDPKQPSPSPLKLPVTINGRLRNTRDVHRFPLQLQAGRYIVAAAICSEFGSPLDPFLRLRNTAGDIVAESFPHRTAQGLLVFKAPTAGPYTLEVFDFQLAGSPQHIYRLTVTDGPWLDYAFPSGVTQQVRTPVTLYGWNLPGENGRMVQQDVQAARAGTQEVSLAGGVNRLLLKVGTHPEIVEAEPNDLPEQAGRLAVPSTVNGRLQHTGDVDVYRFQGTKGDRLAIDVSSADLKFPADLVLTITDASGKLLIEVDDSTTSRDPSLRYAVPADGEYLIHLRDRSGQGGVEFVYRLSVSAPVPRLAAYVNSPALTLHAGETANLAVQVERIDGFAGELQVTAIGLPAGVQVAPQPVEDKPTVTVQLPFTADEKLGPVSGLVRIVVRSAGAQEPREVVALVLENAKSPTGSEFLWAAVGPKVPFALSTVGEILEAPRLAAFPFPVSVKREEGFEGSIRLVGVEPDRRGSVVPLTGEIREGADSGFIPLVVQHGPTEGTTQRCRVMGVAEVIAADGKSYPVFHVAPGSMLMGCQPGYLTMSAAPAVLHWQPGATRQVEIRLMRHVELEAVSVRLELPEGCRGLSCEPVIVQGGQETATLTLRFSEETELSPRLSIKVRAESSRNGLPVYAQTSFRLEER